MINVAGILCSVAAGFSGAPAALPVELPQNDALTAAYERPFEVDEFDFAVEAATDGALPDNNRRVGTGVRPQTLPAANDTRNAQGGNAARSGAHQGATGGANNAANFNSAGGQTLNNAGGARNTAQNTGNAQLGATGNTAHSRGMAGTGGTAQNNRMQGAQQGGTHYNNTGAGNNQAGGTQGTAGNFNQTGGTQGASRNHAGGMNQAGGAQQQGAAQHNNLGMNQAGGANSGAANRFNQSGLNDSQNLNQNRGNQSNRYNQGGLNANQNRGGMYGRGGRNQADMRYNQLKTRLDEQYAHMFALKSELDDMQNMQTAKWQEYHALQQSYDKQLKRIISDWVTDQNLDMAY